MTHNRLAHLAKLTGIAERLLIDDWPELKRFADAVAEIATYEEREWCAREAESWGRTEGRLIASAIRARGTK
jgi:hypothetical protein